jgi:hypothetical protein
MITSVEAAFSITFRKMGSVLAKDAEMSLYYSQNKNL